MRSLSPTSIYDDAGPWVRYDDHAAVITALRAQQPAPAGATLRSMIEGMSVSVDVSTGDHDAGHRYFGTVTEVMECEGDKHGVTLLVQDAEPNFAAPTPQADSQPARDYLPLPDFDAVEQHIYGACRRYITQDMLEPIHNLIRDAIDADRAAQQGYDAARLEIESLRDEVKEYRHGAGVQKALIESLLADKPEDALDAARYRMLRRGQHWSVINGVGDTLRAEELDAAIDAARSKAKEGGAHA